MQQWCIPSVSAAFVALLEDILDLYAEIYDPRYPLVSLDETPLALTAPSRDPIPRAPGRLQKVDYEFIRHGRCTLLGLFQPLTGWREVTVSERQTKLEFAEQLRHLVEDLFPAASTVRVVLDNASTHQLSALYEAFPAAQARAIARKLDLHYTPVHGSWLNMIEIEWSVLAQQCLKGRRLGTLAAVQHEVDAWAAARNARQATVQWRFTTADARQTLHHLYPDPVFPAVQPDRPDVRTVA